MNSNSEILFKGMTRPAMLWGVPLVALIFSVSLIALIAAWTNFLAIILIFPTVFILREIAKKDDFIFDLYLLKLRTKGDLKTMRFWGVNTFAATSYRVINPKEQRLDIHGLPLSSQPDFSKFIPYSSHIAKNIILTKEGDYVATWECSGIPFEIADDDDLELRKEQLNTLLRSFSHYSVSIYHHNISRSVSEKLEGNFKSDYLKEINDLYYAGLENSKFKRNTLYFTLVYRPYPTSIERRTRKKGSVEEKKQELDYHLTKMQEFCNRLEKGLLKFGGRALTTYEKDNTVYSKQLEFYNYLLTGFWQPIRITTEVFYKTLGNTLNHFGVDTGEVVSPQGKRRFFRCIEIKDYVDSTYEGILDVLMYYSIDYTITHSFSLLGRNDAAKALKMQEKHLKSVEDDAETQLEELSLAKDDLASGNLAFGKYHFSITVFGDTLQEATDNTNELINAMQELGFIVVLANIALPATYYAQLPANFEYRPRLSVLSSRNFASLMSLHSFANGKVKNNCWGDAVTVLSTPSGQPYFFNFHEVTQKGNDFGEKYLGNTTVLGASGTGKTVLLTFLQSQLRKFADENTFSSNATKKELTTVYFDKDRGAEAHIRAMGGKYLTLENGKPTGFNPFMCEPTSENLSFLMSLMKLLVTRNGETLSAIEEERLYNAVKSVMALPIELRAYGVSRMLEHLPEGISREEKENSLARRLRAWANGGAYGWVFDNPNDELKFDGYTDFGFDGSEFLDNKDTCAPLTFYLLHRVMQLLDGRRLALFLDEFWKWLKDPIFEDFVYNKFKVIRKEDGIVVPATQSPDEVIKSPIARAVIEQSATTILLPNPKATQKDYVDELHFSQKEFEIVKSLDPDSRTFLVKKGHDSALAKLDLWNLGKNLKVLSTSKDNVPILHNVLAEFGEEPNKWLPVYKQRCI